MKKKLQYITQKGIESLRNEGVGSVLLKGTKYTYRGIKRRIIPEIPVQQCKDILFINGCTLNHPSRYRVEHQKEQLQANNISCDVIWYQNINLDLLKYYRGFIVFRCPITPELQEFIEKGKYFNKTFFYDIDDLVIGDEYVKDIEHLKKLSESELTMYMDGVRRNQQALKLCDYAITTTPALAHELEKFVPEVYINRNVISEEMAHLAKLALENKKTKEATEELYIGYLSGSITHNPDFELIKEPIKKILRENKHVRLVLAGLIDLPVDMEEYKDQIISKPFVDWRKLPETIASLDINLAPIEDTLFNRAKSENKWTEASSVQVVTVASKVGAFEEMIENEVTGFLCKTPEEWYKTITKLIQNPELRQKIAKKAYEKVMHECITMYSGTGLRNFVQSKLKRNIGFVLPGTVVRGGINVIVKHAHVLRDHGIDVTIISEDKPNTNVITPEGELIVVSNYGDTAKSPKIVAYFDTLVASLWTTVKFVSEYPNCSRRQYFVQNFETDFYLYGDPRRFVANSTYSTQSLEMITISKWCQNWLRDNYGKESIYCPNGIDLERFSVVEKDFTGKIRILIEGNSADEYKNVDESFDITNELDKNKFEIWYLSYDKTPKSWYSIDKFFHQIPYHEVAEIYKQCHMIVKSSKVESFSYPPLEMMATGGIAIVAVNGGNAEYVKHKENCMVYEIGDVASARQHIFEVLNNEKLRKTLIKNGRMTAENRDWKNIEQNILSLYQ